MNKYWTIKQTLLVVLLGSAVSFSGSASAAFDLAQAPLFVSGSVDPNVMFLFDDSGSMAWEHMPDSTINTDRGRRVHYMYPRVNAVYDGGTSTALAGCENDDFPDWKNNPPKFDANNRWAAFFRSPQNNAVYYNPAITYQPWKRADNTDFPNAVATAALHNPVNPSLGSRNLTTDLTESAIWVDNGQGEDNCQDHTYYPATYFRYDGGDVNVAASYTRIEVKSGNAPFTGEGREERTDCTSGSCTYNQEIQNFANWYTYYRSRVSASRGGLSIAMSNQPTSMRVGFGAINKGTTSVDGANTAAVVLGVRPFAGNDKDTWFENLFEHPVQQGNTPLRNALNNMGDYFTRTDNRGPWGGTPGSNDTSAHLECRPSFGILMTDGFWNGNNPGVGNQDNANGPSHTDPDGNTGQYTAAEPYQDGLSNTVADVAMKFYKEDLRPNLANRVRASERDPAFWQHMVTYGVGFGVNGNVSTEDALAAVAAGTDIDWGDPFASNTTPAKIDDLLHAAINGRGGFFSAGNPLAFAREFDRIIQDIIARSKATTAVAVASSRLNTESLVYEGAFDSSDWSGDLVALRRDGTVEWSVADILNARTTERKIFTHTSGGGAEFKPGDLDATQEAAMAITIANIFTPAQLGKTAAAAVGDVINYVRGEKNLERPSGPYRTRTSIVGDIVNAKPNFAGASNEGWALLPTADGGGREGAGSYGNYVDNVKTTRPRTILVGSNGGMLHAINAGPRSGGGGEELFAYVPGSLTDELPNLADPEYGHQFFVDAEVRIADARNGSSWTTVAVGGFGAGGRGLYALDVGNPENFATGDVLWELSEADDADLGHIYFKPAVTRLSNGTWVAIFGNGINSGDEDGVLFVVNLFTGSILGKIDTEVGSAANPGGLGGPRFLMNTDDGLSVEFVYAGDLQGNMWKFDISASNAAQWDSYFSQGNNPAPLFTAEDRSNRVQSIVQSPTLARSPAGDLFVYFGTGRYFARGDNTTSGTTPIETFYAVRDASTSPNESGTFRLDRRDLTAIDITAEVSDGGTNVRRLEESGAVEDDGFYIDLEVGNQAMGEKVLATPRIQFGFLLFTTFETSEDACQPGGMPRLYVLNAFTGSGQLTTSTIDCDDCGAIELLSDAPLDVPVVVDEGGPDPDPNDPNNPPGGNACTPSGAGACPWGKRAVEFVLPRSTAADGSAQCLQTRVLGCIKDGRVNWGQRRH